MKITDYPANVEIRLGGTCKCANVHWVIMIHDEGGWYNSGRCGYEATVEQAFAEALKEYRLVR